MPANTRQWAKRKLEQSRNQLNWTGTHLKEVYDKYIEPHPKIGEPIGMCLELLLQIDNLISHINQLI